MTQQDFIHKDLTKKIISAALEVHNNLHNGFLESVYEEAMAIELELQKVPFERQKPVDVFYKGKVAKQFYCDILVSGKVLVELKAIKKLSEIEEAQVLNYLKASKLQLALLVNFGAPSLEFKRIINTY